MIYIREFEFYSSDGCMLAVPCDMDGGTFGATLEDAAESAVDWLFETITDHLIANEVVPGGKLGHERQHRARCADVRQRKACILEGREQANGCAPFG